MLNTVCLQGRLTADPDLRTTQSGTNVVSFTLACEDDYKPQGGERTVQFVDCTAWKSTAEFVSKWFVKGQMAVVSGRLQFREWEDKHGQKRRNAEVLVSNVYFCEKKNAESAPVNTPHSSVSVTTPTVNTSQPVVDAGDDWDMPF